MTASRSRACAAARGGVALSLFGAEEEHRVSTPGECPELGVSRAGAGCPSRRGGVTGARASSDEPGVDREPQAQARSIFVIAEGLVQTWCSNERELAELQELRRRMKRVTPTWARRTRTLRWAGPAWRGWRRRHEDHLARL